MKNILALLCLAVLAACSSSSKKDLRITIDTSASSKPDWVENQKSIWETGGKVFLKNTHTISGTERVNGCYDLAKLDTKETLLSEISNDVRGSIQHAQQSISESAEVVLGKVRTSEFEGKISGLRFTESYFERYRIGDTERIDCHVLAEMTMDNYNQTKRSVVNKVVAVDPKLKEAITKKQIDFFSRTPSSEEQPKE